LKKLLFLFSLLISVLCSCEKKKATVVVFKDRDYRKAESYLYKQNDSAFYYFNRYIAGSKDSFLIAASYSNMAVIQSEAGDNFGSQESLFFSLKYLNPHREKDRSVLASDYNELGLTSLNLKDPKNAVKFYELALSYCDREDLRKVLLNNKALAYQKIGAYRQAVSIYQSAIYKLPKNSPEYARILSNMARTRWLWRPAYPAAKELIEALRIRTAEKDLWGQNASFSHLSDYYRLSKPDSAYWYAGEMYRVACLLNSPDDRLEALQKLTDLGPPLAVKRYFRTYQRLNDSLQTARNAAKNQFALIRYNVEKSEADNLKLQKDNTEKRYQLSQQTFRFYATLLAFLLLILFAFQWYKNRKRQQEQATHNAVRETQLKASKKVHDTLANDVYRIMKKIEHGPDLDRERLLDDIEEVYQRARDLSYEIIIDADEQFHEKISELLRAFATEEIKVVIVGNSAALWQRVDTVRKMEVKLILQELMVNMQKHSQARNVVIKFEDRPDWCIIYYYDDGVGMQEGMQPGNGLHNTGNRIKSIGGDLTFETNESQGLHLQISFPAA
jgi:signal transduction histidine kinase